MSEESRSDSENDGNSENLSSDEHENDDNERISEYEKQRIERIKENRARLEALRLPTLASSLLGSVEKKVKRKGKEKKEEDDEEYKPSEDEKRVSSSSEEGEENSEDEEFQQSRASARKGKGKHPLSKIDKKKNPVRSLDFIDDDEALQQALALSLEESSAVSGAVLHETPQDRRTFVADAELKERKGRKPVQETDKRKKRRIPNTSRVQITEDQVIIHFFQFDDIRRNDTACQHGAFEGIGKQKFQCIYCREIMADGCVTHLIQHLAGTACAHVPHCVKRDMRKCLSEREGSYFGEEVRQEQEMRAVGPQDEEEEDPELRLQQDLEEAMRRSMNDPEYKEMEEIKIAMLESQKLNSHALGGASSSHIPQSTMIIEDSDEELDRILGFDDEGDDDILDF